ncbi:MAG TPA: type II secretion system F family protein [Aeromicrobium sp.]|nr:type II secretion system F family protein [Aeromicrobium sp.]
MIILAAIFVIAALAVFFYAIGVFSKQETEAAARLRDLTNPIEQVEAGSKLKAKSSEGFGRRFTPKAFVDRAERNYMLAGRPENTSVAKILAQRVIFGAVGLVFGLMMFSKGGNAGTLMLVVAPLLGYFAPDIILSSKAKARQSEIQYALPDMLDQITISIESGSSFEAALARSGQTGEGPLADEIVRTIQDLALGISRRDAYEALVARTDVDELRSFVRAITQGEEFGVPVSDIVRDQANEMRVTRRLRAEGKANEVPVKMLGPLMVTILPVLFLVVIGPAVLSGIKAFSGG